jgi:hypothetical protein
MSGTDQWVQGDRREANLGVSASVSLIRGGPFYRAQEATRLIGPGRWNLGRRITLAVAIGWFPLVLLTALYHPSAMRDLLSDYRVAARLLISVPILLLGQVFIESRFRMIVQHLEEVQVLKPPELERLDSIIANLRRWRDSIWPELALVFLVYASVGISVGSHTQENRPWAVGGLGASSLLPAGWYYALVSKLIYQFLVGLSLWKWLLWSYFAFRVSRLDMDLVPTHPDQNGGLGFLGLSLTGCAPVAFAVSAAIGANWRHEILASGAHLADFKVQAVVLLAVLLMVALGPLLFFVPRLAKLRRVGVLQYGILGQIHSWDFHKKWVLDPNRNLEEFLTAPEISTLTDYGTSFENIEKMKPFPVSKGPIAMLVLAVALPMLPAVLAQIPLAVVLKALLDAVK